MKNEASKQILKDVIPENLELINYLHDKLPAEEKRKVEEMISDDALIGDAVEGLQYMEKKDSLYEINSSLNRMIDKKLATKKRLLKPIGFPMWMTLLITIILLAVLAGYVLIKMLNR
jgi:hypothetical protein